MAEDIRLMFVFLYQLSAGMMFFSLLGYLCWHQRCEATVVDGGEQSIIIGIISSFLVPLAPAIYHFIGSTIYFITQIFRFIFIYSPHCLYDHIYRYIESHRFIY